VFRDVVSSRIFIGEGGNRNARLRIVLRQDTMSHERYITSQQRCSDRGDSADTMDMAAQSSVNAPPKASLAMQRQSILGSQELVAFVATRNPSRAKKFYRDTLGLPLVSEDEFALVFDAAGTMLRVTRVQELASSEIHGLRLASPGHCSDGNGSSESSRRPGTLSGNAAR
jgi:hypothetical protein